MTTRLDIRHLGSRAPPEWMSDTERMTQWVTADDGWPRMWVYPGLQQMSQTQADNSHHCVTNDIPPQTNSTQPPVLDENGEEATHQTPRPHGLACWSYEDKDNLYFGWGGARIRIQCDRDQQVKIYFDQWRSTGWRDDEQEPSFWGVLCGRTTEHFYEWLSRFDPFKISYRNAPWSEVPFIQGGGYYFRAQRDGMVDVTDAPTALEKLSKTEQASFKTWLHYQLRRAVRRWPYLRLVTLAGVSSHKTPSYSALALLVRKLETDKAWQEHPMDWLLDHACDPQIYNARAWREARSQQSNYCLESLPLCFDDKDAWPVEMGMIVGEATFRWMKHLPTHQSARIIQDLRKAKQNLTSLLGWGAGIEAMKDARLTGVSARHLKQARKIPLKILLISYRQSHLAQLGENLWLDPIIEKRFSADVTESFQEMKDLTQENPLRAKALRCAVIAKLRSPLSQAVETEDTDTWQLLLSPLHANHPDWRHVKANWAWKTFGRMTQRWQKEKLIQAHQHDLGERHDAQSLAPLSSDPSWHSALGHVRWEGVTVTPICRHSQLKLMGDYFFNCLRVAEPTADFVAQAVQNRFRYFRLEHGNQHALLHLHREEHSERWSVRQLHGLANKSVSDVLQSVAARVGEVYTLLEGEVALMAIPTKDEGGPLT